MAPRSTVVEGSARGRPYVVGLLVSFPELQLPSEGLSAEEAQRVSALRRDLHPDDLALIGDISAAEIADVGRLVEEQFEDVYPAGI